MPVRHGWGEGGTTMRPIRLLHLLDALLSQAGVASQGSSVFQRRQRQRLALMQRLLNPLPGQLHHCNRVDGLFWRGLRWGTFGMLAAWLLRD